MPWGRAINKRLVRVQNELLPAGLSVVRGGALSQRQKLFREIDRRGKFSRGRTVSKKRTESIKKRRRVVKVAGKLGLPP